MGNKTSCQGPQCKEAGYGTCSCSNITLCVSCYEIHREQNTKVQHKFTCFNGLPLESDNQPISMKSIILTKLIYRSPEGSTEVHEGKIKNRLGKYAIKIMHCMNDSDLVKKQKESELQMNIKHPNICECITAFRDENFQNGCRFIIVLELSEEGDMEQEIEKRKLKKNPWGENEIYGHFTELINAFAYLQDHNMTHGDIKPRNLYLSNEGKFKIGDFGESKQSMQALVTQTYQVTGTVVYFSPLLFNTYLDIIKGKNVKGAVRHNPIKSDVYSLGLSFLHMASLSKPSELNNLEIGIDNLQSNVDKAISKLNYTESIKLLITLMLQVQENNRHDFKQLRAYLNPSEKKEHSFADETPKLAKPVQSTKSTEPKLVSISQIQGKAYLLDPNDKLAMLNNHRFQSSARAVVYKDSVLITGGLKNSKSVFRINVATCAASKLQDLNIGRAWHTILYHNQLLYLIGGRSDAKEALASTEVFNIINEDIAAELWQPSADLKQGRENASAISFMDRIYIFGGSHKNGNRWILMESIEMFTNNVWVTCQVNLPEACSGLGVVQKNENTILIVGGSREKGAHSNKIFEFEVLFNQITFSDKVISENDIFASQSALNIGGKLCLLGSMIGQHILSDTNGQWELIRYKERFTG